MICHCDACNYTFESPGLPGKYEIPGRCPDCGKKTVCNMPAVRAATEMEIKDYEANQQIVLKELYEESIGKKCI